MIQNIPLNSLDFHNAHPEARSDGSVHVARYPEQVRHRLNHRGRMVGMDSCGSEIRFVSSAPTVRITISCESFGDEVAIYRGPFQISSHRLTAGVPTPILIDSPSAFSSPTPEILESGGFSSDVWRIVFGRGSYLLHKVETFGADIRAPLADESPAINWLAYGSSITHSFLDGYPFHAARLLHWNVYGKGLSGACHAEAAAADYLAELAAEKKVDIITAELGVNMRSLYNKETFTERAAYLIQALRAANPQTPIALITAFTNNQHYGNDKENMFYTGQIDFDESLRQLVAEAKDADLHLIEGTEILSDFTLLSADLIHPTRSGQALMAHNLSQRLKALIKD